MELAVGDIVIVKNSRSGVFKVGGYEFRIEYPRMRVIGISGDRIHLERESTKESIGWWNINYFEISRCN